ncbi:Cof-type HAD-IIB family hydrolase [uncultured Megasphaera sp.]|uniref:Cof-type HAD-IIB family hydrolase n=1 Tax=uncultured Megasphaera sp. TaxID=165188 RepID=UPI002591C321|nr:Cof-type HAD-IIB family hydrolase [uncultured Megasphaera sp.]
MLTYSLLACDMDGTLLGDDASICQRNIRVIRQAMAAGLHFVPCTGRGFESLGPVQKPLGQFGKAGEYVISYNGALITENKGNTILYEDGLPWDLAAALYAYGTEHNITMHVYPYGKVYLYNYVPFERAFLEGRMPNIETFEKSLDFLRGETIYKIVYMDPDIDTLNTYRQDLGPLLDEITVSYSSNRYLEFNHKQVTKGTALLRLARLLDIPQERTMAIGDNINDIEMLRAASLSVGVRNLNPAIGAYCDVVTDADNNEGAVGEAIERFVLKG